MIKDGKIVLYVLGSLIICLIGLACYKFNNMGITYVKSIPIFVLIITGFLTYIRISQCNWYKELTDRNFLKYKNVYFLYRSKVIDKKQLYNIFVGEYCNSNSMLIVKTDVNGNINVSDYNEKNKVYQQIKYILENRSDLVKKYFNQKVFNYKDYISLLSDYRSTLPPTQITSSTSALKYYDDLEHELINEKLKEFVLVCYGDNGVKHLGDRCFGYFIKHRHPAYSSTKQYTDAWNKYIGEYEPRDGCRYIGDPSYWKNENEIGATLKTLDKISNFYSAFMSSESLIMENIQKDIEKLSELNSNNV